MKEHLHIFQSYLVNGRFIKICIKCGYEVDETDDHDKYGDAKEGGE